MVGAGEELHLKLIDIHKGGRESSELGMIDEESTGRRRENSKSPFSNNLRLGKRSHMGSKQLTLPFIDEESMITTKKRSK